MTQSFCKYHFKVEKLYYFPQIRFLGLQVALMHLGIVRNVDFSI